MLHILGDGVIEIDQCSDGIRPNPAQGFNSRNFASCRKTRRAIHAGILPPLHDFRRHFVIAMRVGRLFVVMVAHAVYSGVAMAS